VDDEDLGAIRIITISLLVFFIEVRVGLQYLLTRSASKWDALPDFNLDACDISFW
jgi:hypothetical protein